MDDEGEGDAEELAAIERDGEEENEPTPTGGSRRAGKMRSKVCICISLWWVT